MKRILLIPGDGIGPEVMNYGSQLLAAVGKARCIEFITTHVDWGAERWLKEKVGIPPGELLGIKDNYDAILFGALGDPRIPDMAHGREILLGLRMGLDLFVNLRPVKLIHDSLGILKKVPQSDIDFVIFRENTQDLYVGAGGWLHQNTPQEIAIDECIHTYFGVERIIKEAFRYAESHGRRQVTLVDKSNAIKFGGSLWQRLFRSVAQNFPKLVANHLFVDVAAMHMVQNPKKFDVVVTSNLFGDILSDLGAGIAGGLGLAASANINPGVIALFEPVHGSAPDLVGRDIANPFAMFMTIAMMMDYLGFSREAHDIQAAVKECIDRQQTTPDLGGKLSSQAAANAVIALIK